jgi:hypothetical protein
MRRPSKIVKCDVCGGIYSRSYLASHKRLAHKESDSAVSGTNDTKAVDRIVAIYNRLSREAKKLVLDRLSGRN